jgi:hypothetical protein
MNRRIRRWLIAAITTVTTGILIWMPTIAQAGLTATAVDRTVRDADRRPPRVGRLAHNC